MGVTGEVLASAAPLLAALLAGALVAVALLTSRGLGAFYAEAGLIDLSDPDYISKLVDLQVESFSETFVVAAVTGFVGLIPAALLGRQTES